ncbi:MAG: EAL domain-containing protein [Syntrophorhabdaceae bacterium]|nr:EAL domain-containing protein [Syntrophorhabdaceae bacterium]
MNTHPTDSRLKENHERSGEDMQIYIGRQPILNRAKRTFGYELLFRSGVANGANITDNMHATASVMVNALNNIGISRLIGDKIGFINVDDRVLESGIIELLPGKMTVLELLETVKVDERVLALCAQTRKKGYQFALDDFVDYDGASQGMFDIASYVKVDLMGTDRKGLPNLVKKLKRHNLKLLAEKVETQEDFETCRDLGFDYFQGYFFEKPSIISARSISPTQLVLLDLSRILAREEEFLVIEALFRKNPELHIKLLQFMNSAAFYTANKINSIGQAIALLGYRKLQKWVTLLLFAGEGYDTRSAPLFERAVIRGRIMELLATRITRDTSAADMAFITGVLSLIDALFQVPLQNILSDFNLSEEIHSALLHRHGVLGKLVCVIENLEQENYDEMQICLKDVNLVPADLYTIENNAILEYETMNGMGNGL